jgi:hypothetical protein
MAVADQDNHPMQNFPQALAGSLFMAMTLNACSPAQNWRDVALEGTTLKAQLPCKPDRTTRSVPLGGVVVDLHMVGCESDSAMVAVMTASLPAGVEPSAVMGAWQKATLDNVRVGQPLTAAQQQAWHRPGQLPLAASLRIQVLGQRANGEPVNMNAVWGAVGEVDRVRLVHAVVYDSGPSVELANTLFEGIKP